MSENTTIPSDGAMLMLEAGDARVELRPADGGRIGSLLVVGRELLVTGSPEGPIFWGAYPMAPWAGRIRHGQFTHAGTRHSLPLAMPPHAIHGVVFDRPWTVIDATASTAVLGIELDRRWPFRGRVEQRFELDDDGLAVTMAIEAREAMPVTMGWHPWFRRQVGDGPQVRLSFDAATMLVRDDEGIPSGERIEPPPGPWDDAFTDLQHPPALEWPGQLRLELESSCRWWVVYTIPEHALCVEPQSGPPDALNHGPQVLEPGDVLRHTMRWRWTRLDGRPDEQRSQDRGRTSGGSR